MKLRIMDEAQLEAQESASWYEDRQDGLGLDFLDALANALDAIEAGPQRFARMETLRTRRDVRQCPLRRFPFAVVFEMRTDEVLVIAVAHAARRPNYWKRRLRQ